MFCFPNILGVEGICKEQDSTKDSELKGLYFIF